MNNNTRIELYNIITELAKSFNARMPKRCEITANAFNDEIGSLTFESDFQDSQIDKIEVGLIVHGFFDEEEKRASKAIFCEFLSKLPLDVSPDANEPEVICPDGDALSFEWHSYSHNFDKQND